MKFHGLIDCNNFFVSCERIFRPDLQSKPTLVLSSNDGCVIARSQEVKDMNVPMGIPYFKVKDMLENEDIAVFSSNFTLYRDVSSRVFTLLRQELGTIEQYSIDEAFFTIEAESISRLDCHMVSLREKIFKDVGIPVSIGLSATKTQAKYVNGLAKKTNGVRIVDNSEFQEMAESISLGDIWGVGRRRKEQFSGVGIVTVKDLILADIARLEKLFGIEGKRLQSELSGDPITHRSRGDAQQKSVMSTRSFGQTTTDLEVVLDAVAHHVRHASKDIRGLGLKTKCLRVMLYANRYSDYMLRGGSKEIVLDAPTDDTLLLIRQATSAIKQLYEEDVPYKKTGVVLSCLTSGEYQQDSLFENQKTTNNSALMKAIDDINVSLGGDMLEIGNRMYASKWQSKRDLISPKYTTNWKEIVKVKA